MKIFVTGKFTACRHRCNGGQLTVGVNVTGGHTFIKVYNDRRDTAVNDAGGKFATIVSDIGGQQGQTL